MKRLRSSLALVAFAALILLVAVGAQSPAKRAMDLDDILAFRAMGTTGLAKNGQWFDKEKDKDKLAATSSKGGQP